MPLRQFRAPSIHTAAPHEARDLASQGCCKSLVSMDTMDASLKLDVALLDNSLVKPRPPHSVPMYS
uniref:Uncharacterized protein n=1 Tax=Peronospora matthiolae TaxID=2874970 RepID=A0AAV1UF61_9STRA